MNLEMERVADIEARHTSGAYSKRPLTLVRGDGCYVWDDEDRRYLDMASGIGVASIGHNHPTLVQAISDQSQRLITAPEFVYNDRRAELYHMLASLTPDDLNRFFLCNSGTEAVEGALKAARHFTGRSHIVATKRGFHGRTLGALGTTWEPKYRQPFDKWTIGDITHIAFNNVEAAASAITHETAAVIVEAIQGEGGVHPADKSYLHALRCLCDEHGVLLIIDEIQSGIGRTGKWFAFEHAEITPDIITLGKGVAGGIPMGVVCWKSSLGQLKTGLHGSTFGGNPLACVAGTATLNTLITMDAPQHASLVGSNFMRRIQQIGHPFIREVRGRGLMIGIELRGRVTPLLKGLQGRGVIALSAGKTVLRLLPPLVVTQTQLETVANLIEETLHEIV